MPARKTWGSKTVVRRSCQFLVIPGRAHSERTRNPETAAVLASGFRVRRNAPSRNDVMLVAHHYLNVKNQLAARSAPGPSFSAAPDFPDVEPCSASARTGRGGENRKPWPKRTS